ncbi:DUF2442 domain-containing protein [Clostridium baratii]|uniref:DUF2442 domain-containing protein n=1 Tax=Clostridium baratii TaxID=1561 RepID=UPI001C22BBD8|nr:DUF2442 domain-containing protein [Clostridium baratii]
MVKEVIPKDDYILQLKLNTKEKILFDVKPYLNIGDFIILKDLKEFENFIADEGGVCWNCGVSLSWDTILK